MQGTEEGLLPALPGPDLQAAVSSPTPSLGMWQGHVEQGQSFAGIKQDASSLASPFVRPCLFHALEANLCLTVKWLFFPFAAVIADGKGGFNELLFSFGD